MKFNGTIYFYDETDRSGEGAPVRRAWFRPTARRYGSISYGTATATASNSKAMTGYLSKGTFEGIADRTWTGRVMGQAKWLAEDAMEIGGRGTNPSGTLVGRQSWETTNALPLAASRRHGPWKTPTPCFIARDAQRAGARLRCIRRGAGPTSGCPFAHA